MEIKGFLSSRIGRRKWKLLLAGVLVRAVVLGVHLDGGVGPSPFDWVVIWAVQWVHCGYLLSNMTSVAV